MGQDHIAAPPVVGHEPAAEESLVGKESHRSHRVVLEVEIGLTGRLDTPQRGQCQESGRDDPVQRSPGGGAGCRRRHGPRSHDHAGQRRQGDVALRRDGQEQERHGHEEVPPRQAAAAEGQAGHEDCAPHGQHDPLHRRRLRRTPLGHLTEDLVAAKQVDREEEQVEPVGIHKRQRQPHDRCLANQPFPTSPGRAPVKPAPSQVQPEVEEAQGEGPMNVGPQPHEQGDREPWPAAERAVGYFDDPEQPNEGQEPEEQRARGPQRERGADGSQGQADRHEVVAAQAEHEAIGEGGDQRTADSYQQPDAERSRGAVDDTVESLRQPRLGDPVDAGCGERIRIAAGNAVVEDPAGRSGGARRRSCHSGGSARCATRRARRRG